MTDPITRIPFTKGGITVSMGKRFQVVLPGLVFRARLTGLLFDTSKSFLLPPAIHGIRALKRLFDEHKNVQLLITGHTDRAGTDAYNLLLSRERADSMSAYLRDAVDEWTKFYGADISGEKRWGAREDGLMIGQVVPAAQLDGTPTRATPANARAFQQFSNDTRGTSLRVDGSLGAKSRRELVAAYMAQPGTSLPAGVVPLTHGCGPFHNDVPTAPGVAEPRNRRSEVFFFEGPVDPPPRRVCPSPAGCPEYPEWLRRTTRTVDLDRGVGTLTVQVRDAAGQAIAGAAVHLDGPFSEDGTTGSNGDKAFPDLPAGSYAVAAAHPDFESGQASAALTDGAQVTATVALKGKRFDLEVLVEDAAQQPLSAASVAINTPGIAPAATDASGLARFTGLPRGTFTLTATHQGFQSGSTQAQVPAPTAATPAGNGFAAGGGAPAPVPITLAANAPAPQHPGFVEVRDSLNNPIPGALVEVIGLVRQPADAAGRVPFARPDSMTQLGINVSMAGFSPQVSPFQPGANRFLSVAPPADGGVITVNLTRNVARLTVLVRQNDAARTPIAGASVGVDGITAANQDTPANGRLGPFDIPLGSNASVRQRVHGSKANFGRVPAPGAPFDPATLDTQSEAFQTLTDGQVATVEIVLVAGAPPHQHVLVVRDSFNAVIPGAQVEVIGLISQAADAAGQITFQRPDRIRTLGINVSKPGFSPQAQPFQPGANRFIQIAPPPDGQIITVTLTRNVAKLTVKVHQGDAAQTPVAGAGVGVDGLTATNQDTPASGILGPFEIPLGANATLNQRVHARKAGFGRAPSGGGAFDPNTIDTDVDKTVPLADGAQVTVEIGLRVGVVVTTADPVTCPGLDQQLTATPAGPGGTFAWSVGAAGPTARFFDAAGAVVAAPTGPTVLFRCFQPDNVAGTLPERTIEVTLTYSIGGRNILYKKKVTVHAVTFAVTNTAVTPGTTRTQESAAILVLRNAPGVPTMTTTPTVQITVPATCPRPDVCAQNYRMGWLQTVLTNQRDVRYTDTLLQVGVPLPIRDALAGTTQPFYGATATFVGNNDLQSVNHQDSPGQSASWVDPRAGAPAPPPAVRRQLRSVQFSNGFTAWLVIQNLHWNAFEMITSLLFLRNFNWSMQLNVTVNTANAVGSRATPIQQAPTISALSNGMGANAPNLSAPVANTSATSSVAPAATLP